MLCYVMLCSTVGKRQRMSAYVQETYSRQQTTTETDEGDYGQRHLIS